MEAQRSRRSMVPGSRGRRVVSRRGLQELGKNRPALLKRRLRAATRNGLGVLGGRVRKLDVKLPGLRKVVAASSQVAGWNTAERVAAGMTERECKAAELLGSRFARFAEGGSPASYGYNLQLAYGDVEIAKGIKPAQTVYDYTLRANKTVGGFPLGTKIVNFMWGGAVSPAPAFGCSFKAVTGVSSWAEECKEAKGLKDLLCEQVVENLKKAKGLYMMVVTDNDKVAGGSAQKDCLDRLIKHGFKLAAKAESTHNMGALSMTKKVENDYNVCLLVGDWGKEK